MKAEVDCWLSWQLSRFINPSVSAMLILRRKTFRSWHVHNQLLKRLLNIEHFGAQSQWSIASPSAIETRAVNMTSTKLRRTLVSLANAKFQGWVVFKLFSTVTLGHLCSRWSDAGKCGRNFHEHYAIILLWTLCNYIIIYYSIPDWIQRIFLFLNAVYFRRGLNVYPWGKQRLDRRWPTEG